MNNCYGKSGGDGEGIRNNENERLKLAIVGDNRKNHSCGSIHPRIHTPSFFPKQGNPFTKCHLQIEARLNPLTYNKKNNNKSLSSCIDAFRDDIPRPIPPVQLKVWMSMVTLPNVQGDNHGLVSSLNGEIRRLDIRVRCCPTCLRQLHPRQALLPWRLLYPHPTAVTCLSRQFPHQSMIPIWCSINDNMIWVHDIIMSRYCNCVCRTTSKPISLTHVSMQPKPLVALTINLRDTYSRRNSAFRYDPALNPKRVLTKPSVGCKNNNYDNENSDYIIYVNDVLSDVNGKGQRYGWSMMLICNGHWSQRYYHRYIVKEMLGSGTFGQVVKCRVIETGELVSVKIIKNKPAYLKQSLIEVDILKHVSLTQVRGWWWHSA